MGQTAATPNILTDATLLAHFTANFSDIAMANFKPGPANDSFSVLSETTGPLGTTPSVISTTYICQVPRLKSAASLIVAILVADLVLLQAVWQLYKLVAEAFVVMKKPSANYCEGCLKVHRSDSRGSPATSLLARNNVSSEYHALVDSTGFSSRDDDIRQHTSNEP
ncbi:hypothetical protein G7Z17_g3187 [Cylindrodendrum hubeiense]|uniref:Uncharacterized protein n=1 Tax=Cylindrodendrum hubeiense TaxID=595255 RepID=A0A9P5HGC6_9HYPO|nr:hypothetical protein G7Z17_g3187 [Cylindrodendrum hubeiense]